jgi:GcrA cell cycle regulator
MADLKSELDEQLAALAAAGRSSSQIGRELGITRNAVIGRCRRRGIRLLSRSGDKVVKAHVQPEPKITPVCQPFDAGRFPIGQRVQLSQQGVDTFPRRPDRAGTISGLSATPERSRRVKWDSAKNPELWSMTFLAPVDQRKPDNEAFLVDRISPTSASPSRSGKGRAPRQFSREAPKVAPLSKKLLAAFAPPPVAIEPREWSTVDILGLTPTTCRWPIGDDPRSPDLMYCGAPKETGSYCAAHNLIAYTPRGLDKVRRDAARGSRFA